MPERADQMAYLPKSVGDYLVERGWATLDRNSGVYYVARVRDARGEGGLCPECQLPARDGEHQLGCSRDARGDDGETDRQRELRTGVANTTVENYRRGLEDVNEMVFAHCRRLGIPLMSPPRVAEALDALAEAAARSPQGEDHEPKPYAGQPEWRPELGPPDPPTAHMWGVGGAGPGSNRPSPSRDGIARQSVYATDGELRRDVCWGCGAPATTTNAAWPVCAMCKDENAGVDSEGATRSMRRQKAARSPQDEDHEAGIEARMAAFGAYESALNERATVTEAINRCADAAIAAYLSRVSPSRDGSVAVEDWRAVAIQLAALLRGLHPQNPYYREKQAEALAAFDALAGESNEGGNQNDERRH